MEMNMTGIDGWFGKKLLTWNSFVVITFYHLLQIILPEKNEIDNNNNNNNNNNNKDF